MSFLFGVSAYNKQDFSMTANSTKTQGEMSDDENFSNDSQGSDTVADKGTPDPIADTAGASEVQQQSSSEEDKRSPVLFRPGRTLLGLGVFALLTGGIILVTNQLKPSGSMAGMEGMEGMDRGNMSHDEMMAVDGSFKP